MLNTVRALSWMFLIASASAQNSGSASPTKGQFKITGTVVSASGGEALAHTRVMLLPTSTRQLASSIITAEDGRFVFPDLAPGKYSLQAQRRGFRAQFLDEHDGYSTAVAVGPTKDSENILFNLKPAASISGRVTDEQGDPVREGQVMLFHRGVEGGDLSTHLRAQTSLDDQGIYHFSNLPAGIYFVAVSARPWYAQNNSRATNSEDKNSPAIPENATLDVAYPLTYYPGATDPDGARAITLPSGGRATAEIALSPVPAVHVFIANTTSEPGQNVNLMLSQRILGGGKTFVQGQNNRPNADTLEITGIAPGRYEINYQVFSPQGGRVQSGRVQEVDVSADGALNGASAPALASVSGVVTFEGGPKPPQQAHIQFSSHDAHFIGGTALSAAGEFEGQQLPPGWYDVRVPNTGLFSIRGLSATGARVAGLRLHITGSAPVQLTVTMSSALGDIDGVVKFEGKPVAGAMVVLVPEDFANHPQWFRRDQSDSDGTFSLGHILPGKYTLLAIKDGWEMEWTKPEVLQRYLPDGEVIQVLPNGKLAATLKLQ